MYCHIDIDIDIDSCIVVLFVRAARYFATPVFGPTWAEKENQHRNSGFRMMLPLGRCCRLRLGTYVNHHKMMATPLTMTHTPRVSESERTHPIDPRKLKDRQPCLTAMEQTSDSPYYRTIAGGHSPFFELRVLPDVLRTTKKKKEGAPVKPTAWCNLPRIGAHACFGPSGMGVANVPV